MKNLKVIFTTAIVALFFTGCAGLTDANLSEIENNEADTPVTEQVDRQQRNADAAAGDYFRNGDQEDIIDVRSDDDENPRE